MLGVDEPACASMSSTNASSLPDTPTVSSVALMAPPSNNSVTSTSAASSMTFAGRPAMASDSLVAAAVNSEWSNACSMYSTPFFSASAVYAEYSIFASGFSCASTSAVPVPLRRTSL